MQGSSKWILHKFLELVRDNNKSLLASSTMEATRNMLPAKEIVLKVDVEKVKSLGIIPEGMDSLVVPEMRFVYAQVGWRKKIWLCWMFWQQPIGNGRCMLTLLRYLNLMST